MSAVHFAAACDRHAGIDSCDERFVVISCDRVELICRQSCPELSGKIVVLAEREIIRQVRLRGFLQTGRRIVSLLRRIGTARQQKRDTMRTCLGY